jgi:hypothetical protein
MFAATTLRFAVAWFDAELPDTQTTVCEPWRDNYQNALAALRIIRETIETLGPPGVLPSERSGVMLYGPEPIHERQAIVDARLGSCLAPRHQALRREKRVHASFDAGEPSPQPTGSPPLFVTAAINPCQKRFCRTNRGWRYALVQPRFGELPVGGESARRVFRKLIRAPGMFVRILAELFAVTLQPIVTMLLVNRDCKQSNTIAVMLDQSGLHGLSAAA